MACLDHLLPFIDNGGRRSYVERRRNSNLVRIPQRRKSKERRVIYDRRKALRYDRAHGFRAWNDLFPENRYGKTLASNGAQRRFFNKTMDESVFFKTSKA